MVAEDTATAAPTESTTSVSETSPSPAPSPQSTEAPSPSPTVTPSETPAKTPKETVLDAVLKVIPADTETDALAEPKAKPDSNQPEEGTTETSEDDDDEAEPGPDASTPQIRKKIQKLLKKYHAQKKDFYAATQELTALRPTAQIGVQMQTFARENDLSGNDVAKLMEIGAAARRGDYKAVYEAVSPIVRKCQEYLGIALPKEARDLVQKGQMTEAMAREHVRLQMDRQLTETRLSAEQQVAARRNLQGAQEYIQRTVNALEAQFAAKDPDYKAKAASVEHVAKALLFDRGGTITNVQEALEITKKAYDTVNANLRAQRAQPQPTTRHPNGNGQTRSARPEPASPYEAAILGLERARNGAGY